MYTFKRIDDVEILTSNTDIKINCVGTKKTGSDLMIEITHDHSTDLKDGIIDETKPRPYYKGKTYIFMTKEQAQELFTQLSLILRHK